MIRDQRITLPLPTWIPFRKAVAILMVFTIVALLAPASSFAVEKASKKARDAKELVEHVLQEELDPLAREIQEKLEKQKSSIATMRDGLDQLGQSVRSNEKAAQELKTKLEQNAVQTREGMDQMGQSIRAHEKSIVELKSKMEENAVRIYERLLADKDLQEKLGALAVRVAENKARIVGNNGNQQHTSAPSDATSALSQADTKGVQSLTVGNQATGGVSQNPGTVRPESAGGAATQSDTSSDAIVSYDGAATRLLIATLLLFAVPFGLTLLEASQLEKWAVPHAGLRNFSLSAVLVMAYFTVGFGVMFGEMSLGTVGDAADVSAFTGAVANDDLVGAFRLYQLGLVVVAGMVVTTILSDRLSLPAYVFLALILGTVAYPMLGRWSVNGLWSLEPMGWLEKLGFVDFAGSTVIHSFAAWVALAVAWVFPVVRSLESAGGPSGTAHQPDVSAALVGMLIVWVGWFGLIVGHQDVADPHSSFLVVNTLLAGASAFIVSIACWIVTQRKSGVGATYARIASGTIGGLVAISAAVNSVTPFEAIVIGGTAALLQPVAYRILATRIIKQDEVAANLIAAHGFCGVWGTLCAGLFGTAGLFGEPDLAQTGIQVVGVSAAFIFGAATGWLSAVGYRALARVTDLRQR